jgi:tetratricopeptide (TPR) repeat protein
MRKSLLILIAVLGFSGVTSAQEQKWGEDSVTCRDNLLIFYEGGRSKNFKDPDIYNSWSYVYNNCPGASKNTFIYGVPFVETRIKMVTDQAEKDSLAKMLVYDLYDKRLEYFPEKFDYVKYRKALDMIQYFPDSTKAAHNLFIEALADGGPEQDAAFYDGYFKTAVRLFNEKFYDVNDVFNSYNIVLEGIEVNNNALNRQLAEYQQKIEDSTLTDKEQKIVDKAIRELERYEKVELNAEKILAPISTCEKLAILYNEESFEANKTDPVWLRRASKMLSKEKKTEEGEYEDCTDNPIFFKIAEELYRLEPSANAARALGISLYRESKYTKAIEYFKEAGNLEVDPKKAANDYMRIASSYLKVGSYGSAKSAALKAASLRRGWGEPYVLIAQIYGSVSESCGSNAFEKRAVYWAAIDKLNYAKSIDSDVSSKASRLISSYKQQLPDKTISFQFGHAEGEVYSIGCIVNETITVKFY